MGVNGLWTVVQPCARPTNLAQLNRKRLAVDASIWIYQFLKAVRDKEGNALRNSHVVGFFRRICKLLWYGIRPVFVFDGGAPALKRATLQGRRQRREGRREDAARTAGKLLAVQMHRMAEEEEEKRKRRVEAAAAAPAPIPGTVGAREVEEEQEQLPDMDHIVYADEHGMSMPERKKSKGFYKQDAYHLPELQNGIEAMGKPDDPRIMSVEELEEYSRQFHNGEDINLYDFSKIDFDGEFFKSLPPADRYNILNAARIRSRLRMGLSKEQLDKMFPDRMAFSRFQIERVRERNHLTQRLMYEMGMTGTDLTVGFNARIAGDKNREYILVKNEGAEGGWALGVVSRDKDRGQIHKPIDVDALDFQYQAKNEDEDEDDEEFEDVPIEGLNRLPKPSQSIMEGAYQRAQDIAAARKHFYDKRQAEDDEAEESLFVENDHDSQLFGDDDAIEADEEEDINRAIALSLQNQHGVGAGGEEEEDQDSFEDVPMPRWTQKATEAPKPITSIGGSTSGRMVAHIVNNRASAAVPRRRDSESSDSDVDIRTALAAAARKKNKPSEKLVQRAPIKPNVKNPFDGPLPFEKLNLSSMLSRLAKTPLKSKEHEKPKAAKTGELEAESDNEAGGFEREVQTGEGSSSKPEKAEPEQAKDDAPRPLPPWLADTSDIRDSLRKQQELDNEMNAADQEMADEEEFQFLRRREDEIVEIDSSDENDSDVEFIDAPPPPVRRQPPVKPPGEGLPSLEDDIVQTRTVPSDKPLLSKETGRLALAGSEDNNPATQQQKSTNQTDISEEAFNEPSLSPPAEEEFEEEFEDVALPTQPAEPTLGSTSAQELEDARIEAELFGEGPMAQDTATDNDGLLMDPDAPAAEEFDDLSDPEEEELLAQLAEEAEEHARFASELNNKSQRENQEAYEQELKALRTQQKKDRRDADEVTQIMVTECQALLRLFGIPYITAPMEAEAQCAELVHLNLVDGIVTDDSDIFLFGGTRVYKNMFNGNKFVECYLANDLEKELSLSREQLISIAQLLGSDYTEGLPGVGPVTALEILSEFPGKDGLAEFKDWWQDVQVQNRPKEADAASTFRRKFRKSQATKLFLPVGFPSPAVFEAYLKPEVDDTPEPFQWGVPDLDGLRRFLMTTIGWSQERTDEVLVPVIRDMNKREKEGTQSNITRYFEGSVGVGAKDALAPRQRAKGSKRMTDAVNKLREKSGLLAMQLPVGAPPAAKTAKKRKATREPVVVEDDDGGDDDNGDDEQDVDDSGTESQAGDNGARRKGNGRDKGKGKRAKA